MRHLASSTSVYEAVVRDVLAIIEGASLVGTVDLEAYTAITDHLKIVLDARETGSLPAILRCCRVLLGEAT